MPPNIQQTKQINVMAFFGGKEHLFQFFLPKNISVAFYQSK